MTEKLPFLNVGCGSHFHDEWVNLDFVSTGPEVVAHNLLNGIPFNNDSFEVVYHSHVLEHFSKNDGRKFIRECYRVLKPGGIIRIAVPDLEQIVNNYMMLLAKGKADMDDKKNRADYDWILTEMYDQTVRNESGGEMAKILSAESLVNEDFIMQRIGYEGHRIRQNMFNPVNNNIPRKNKPLANRLISKIKRSVSFKTYKDRILRKVFENELELIKLSKFRQSGEIHQWMYDFYSLSSLLKDTGFKNIEKKEFDQSSINSWRSFGLDEVENTIRKPDSLFVEALK